MEFENGNSEMVVIDEANEAKKERKFPFRTSADGGVRKKRKKTPAEKHLKLKKQVQPKNAVTCLNELVPGIGYIAEDCSGTNAPFAFSVTVNGHTYRGYGSSKTMAKQAAAEAALISFVKPPSPADGESKGEDTTPWTVLASFAMFRLFNEWREGRIGVCTSTANIQMESNSLASQPSPVKTDSALSNSDKSQFSNVLSAYLGGKKVDNSKVSPKPAKGVPENADKLHPVMLLHQLRPQVSYAQSSVIKDNQAIFTLTTSIDDKKFSGQGSNLKKAKFNLAVNALDGIFNIKSVYGN